MKRLALLFALLLVAPARADTTNAPYLQNSAGDEIGTSAIPLRINPTGATTQPVSGAVTVSGTVTANQGTQGTNTSPWYVNLRNAAGTEIGTSGAPVRTDPTGTTTQPISAASLPLPTGAATEASLTKLPIAQGASTTGNSGTLSQGAATTAAPTYTTATINPLSLTLAGALRVDGSAVTQPVSGTVTANLGTVDGLALDATVAKLTLAQASSTSAQTGPMVQGATTTAAPTYTTATTNPLSLTLAGALRTDSSATTQPISAASLPLPSGATTAANQATMIASLATIDLGIPTTLGQTAMASAMPVVIASDQTALPVTLSAATKTTYAAAFSGVVTAALATDVACLTGSGTKTIKISHIELTATTTTGSGTAVNATLVKRSTADTGGTSAALTIVPYDSTNAAGTATAVSYTANPTLGTSVGSVRAYRLDAVTAGLASSPGVWDFGDKPTQLVTLRGTAQQLCINFNATTITGPLVSGSFEFTEE